MVDLTRDEQGRMQARLFDAGTGRPGTAYATWVAEQGLEFTVEVEYAALDPFRGYANAIRERAARRLAVLDAFHIVKLGSQALDGVRRRVQQQTLHRRGEKNDPLYRFRRTLMTGVEQLTDKQTTRLNKHLEAGDPTWEVTIARLAYQELREIARRPRRTSGVPSAAHLLSPSCDAAAWPARTADHGLATPRPRPTPTGPDRTEPARGPTDRHRFRASVPVGSGLSHGRP
ncbi:MAG: transposase [Actinomycetota bacterium]|nr:transposase [Actinomycetota bacterium]